MYAGPERRKYTRIRQPSIVEFNVVPGGAGGEGAAGCDVVGMEDLGAGGVLFKSKDKIEIGTLLEFTISLQGVERDVHCGGEVIRIKELSYSHMFLVAAMFTDISEEDKEMINKIADDFYPERLQG